MVSSIFSIGVPTAYAISEGDDGNNPLQIVIEPSEDAQSNNDQNSINKMNMEEYPDLGSEQVFPFEAGFGKNSGKNWLSFKINIAKLLAQTFQ